MPERHYAHLGGMGKDNKYGFEWAAVHEDYTEREIVRKKIILLYRIFILYEMWMKCFHKKI